jgi:hypothetical protein
VGALGLKQQLVEQWLMGFNGIETYFRAIKIAVISRPMSAANMAPGQPVCLVMYVAEMGLDMVECGDVYATSSPSLGTFHRPGRDIGAIQAELISSVEAKNSNFGQ